jgi:hypothetical protein
LLASAIQAASEHTDIVETAFMIIPLRLPKSQAKKTAPLRPATKQADSFDIDCVTRRASVKRSTAHYGMALG